MGENREVLYAADIAKIRGCSLRTARSWLAALEHEHGSKVIRRVGGKLCVTRRALDGLLPGVNEPGRGVTFGQLYRQVQAIAQAVHDLRELVNDLTEGMQSVRMRLHALGTASPSGA